ncbi:MAG: trypsin-like peptidase domain-containing protein [Planctomycetaceae bacterium]|nr:trypsin-like peptidase domain-containing protein [Planctomycetaceae bacterium]
MVIPGGGFGSGFLLGDRETIATAAHCVACEDVSELEIVFHPTEPRETRQKGAKLIYFDAKQDVALLHLSEEMPAYHPFFWTPRAADKEDDVTVLGNPGRAGFPDPMYSRSAQVKGTRPDEFFIDIEVKPGYSGGPVILDHTMNAVGITSFKYINTEKYEKDGQSFAKSSDIASDAYTHWAALSDSLKASKLQREEERYNERFHFIEADEVATAIFSDSFTFLLAVIDVIRDYKRHMNVAMSGLPNPVSVSVFKREERKAHREYLKEEGPKKAEEIRERISPDLLFERGYQERYDKIIEDPDLPKHLKEHLVSANEHFTTIREALENVVDPSGRSSKGKTLIEFVDYVVDEFNSAQFHCRKVAEECRGRTQ